MSPRYPIILLLFLALITRYQPLIGQNINLSGRIGSTGNDNGVKTLMDDSDNVYVCGFFTGTCNFSSAYAKTSNGGSDVFLAKYDCNNTLLWVQTMGGPNNDQNAKGILGLGINNNHQVYLSGLINANGIVTSRDGNNAVITTAGATDAILVKFSPGGNIIWYRQYGNTGNEDACNLAVDKQTGDVILTGFFTSANLNIGSTTLSNAGAEDVFLCKINASGTEQWAKSIGGSSNDLPGQVMDLDASGNILLCGRTDGSLTIGSRVITHTGTWAAWATKFNPLGVVQWVVNSGTTGSANASGFISDAFGKLLLSMDFSGTVTFTDGLGNNVSYTSTGAGFTDFFLARINNNGAFNWTQRSAASTGASSTTLATDPQGRIYIAGHFSGTLNYGSLNASSTGGTDCFFMRTDSLGTASKLIRWGGTGTDQNPGLSLSPYNSLSITGTFSNSFSLGTASLTSYGNFDAFVLSERNDSSFTFLPSDTALCNKTNFTITSSGTYNAYLWNTNATTANLTVTNTGWYKLRVQKNCSYYFDSAYIRFDTCEICPSGIQNYGPELITNGDFTKGNQGFTTGAYSYSPSHTPGSPISQGLYDLTNDASTIHFAWTGMDHTNLGGRFMAINGSTTGGTVWKQTIAVSPNKYYSLGAYFNNLAEPVVYGGLAYAMVHFRINGTQVSNVLSLFDYPDRWIRLDTIWYSGSNTSIDFEIYNVSSAGNGNDFGIDDITFKECLCVSTIATNHDTTICTGSSVTLTTTGSSNRYLWSTGDTTATITVSPTATTVYWVRGQVGTATCYSYDTVIVAVSNCSGNCISCTASNPLNNGLVACYPFNGNTSDETGHGYNGTNIGATLTTDRFGNPNSAFSFNGSWSYISIPYNAAFNFAPTGSYSLCAWVCPNSGITSFGGVVVKSTGTGVGAWDYGLYHTSNYKAMTGFSNNNLVTSLTSVPANKWYYLVATYSDGDWKMYVNCQLDYSIINSSFKITQSNGGLAIGRKGDFAGDYFSGKIDEVRIYNRSLSLSEIQQMFNCNAYVHVQTNNDTTICSAGPKVLTATGTTDHFFWSTGDTGTTITVYPLNTTTYWVRGQLGTTSCYDYDTVTIYTIPLPNIKTNNDTLVCKGTPLTLTTQGNVNRYLWSNGDTTSTTLITVLNDTVIWVRGQSGNVACFATDTIHITAPNNPIISTLIDTSVCSGGSLLLTTSGNATRYLWSSGDTTASLNISTNKDTTYWVRGQIGNLACYSFDTVRVHAIPYFPVNLGNDTTICEGANLTLTAKVGVPRIWSTTDTTLSITITGKADTVNFLPSKIWIVSGVGNCLSSDTLNIVTLPKPAVRLASGSSNVLCLGELTTLKLDRVSPLSRIIWNTGDTTLTITIKPTSSGWYSAGYRTGTCGFRDSIYIQVIPKPVILVSSNTDTICVGESATLSGRGAPGYLWNTGQTDSDIIVTPLKTTTYWALGLQGTCVSDTQKVTLVVVPKPVAIFSANPTKGAIPLKVKFTNQSLYATSCLWDFGDGETTSDCNPEHLYPTKGSYKVMLIVTNDAGCTDTVSMDILAQEKFVVYIPNAFSPNQDGVNDTFNIMAEGVKNLEGKIFNRWGEQVYEWKEPGGSGWDGTFNGQAVTEGLYIYVLNVKDVYNYRHIFKGVILVTH